jgi:hypothetical protein
MLADPRANALAERFFMQWLGIDGWSCGNLIRPSIPDLMHACSP